MMGYLVFIILLGSFHEVQVIQALPQAKLTVNSSSITETDSVTISCEAPAHPSVNLCYFHVKGGTLTPFPCMKTITGTELLLMAKQKSSCVVEVTCYYIGDRKSPSPDSDTVHITIMSSSVTSSYKVAAITEKAGNHEAKGKNIENESQKRKQTNIADQSVQMIDNTEMLQRDAIYSIVTSAPAADWSTDSDKSTFEDSSAEDPDVDSVYYTIPPPLSTGDGV
ncbi:PREDICTED: uncharacterized protein LOC106918040 [Poecilia mexicana]|uniref:uncharacterized protein LOC106918040 n=1 Tax=Poecilia mexicana TaxID=48701 RepID=UPI00072E9550|nr:PREDICTED: uncharacterized protein LOC106918040 [Poecilia mexicana]